MTTPHRLRRLFLPVRTDALSNFFAFGAVVAAWPGSSAFAAQGRPMLQGLGWEQYAFPTSLAELLAGNSTDMSMSSNPANKNLPIPARVPAAHALLTALTASRS